jgi:hypothetical protein
MNTYISRPAALVLPLLLLGLLLIIAPHAGLAQNDAGTCPALVTQALDQLGQNCDLLDRNSACYGYNRVDATFTQALGDDFFSQPADRSELTFLDTIETAPLDVDQEFWGIAVLNVQANIPNTLPGQAVTFILLGDVEVENAVAPEDAIQPADPINVTTAIGANVRSNPSANANLIGSAAPGTELAADGLSTDGNWLRILFAGGTGWISREVIDTATDVSSLPTIERESRTPMQSFYFSTGFGDPTCNEAPPSLLVVQGPNNVSVDITANGADITIGSTIALMILPGNQLQLIVVSGEAKLGDVSVPAGFKITAPLSEDGKTVTGPFQNLQPLTQEDLDNLQPLENLPPNLLHYEIDLPTLADIQALLDAFNNANNPEQTNGDNPNVTEGAAGDQVNCSAFRPTSPLNGLPYGPTTFYWDAAPGATSYQVNVFNEGGGQVASFETGGGSTNLTGDLSNVGGGFTFAWQVLALFNGQVACSSAPITMFREAVPTQIPPPVATAEPTAVGTEECCAS